MNGQADVQNVSHIIQKTLIFLEWSKTHEHEHETKRYFFVTDDNAIIKDFVI